MKIYSTFTLATLAFAVLAQPAVAQVSSEADPACLTNNADGSKTIDMAKCPDGLKPAAGAPGQTTTPADSTSTQPTTAAPEAETQGQTTATDTGSPTPSATAMGDDVIVSADAFKDATVMTASDFIGKRVYTRAGEDIGEVNDLIVTGNGTVQAVILGVGGFLGIGEKDVAVNIRSIKMQPDGNSAKLVVDASKDQLTNAPGYDREKRTYIN